MRVRTLRSRGAALLLCVLVAGLIAWPAQAGADAGSQAYSDVAPTHWAAQAIVELSGQHIISGFPDGTFRPDQPITRAEFALLLLRAMAITPHVTDAQPFTDVSADAWYAAAMDTAADVGFVSGSAGNGRPLDPITRQEAAVMLSHAVAYGHLWRPGTLPADLPGFADRSAIAVWAQRFVSQVTAAGLMQGDPDGNFQPLRNLSRAEAAVVMVKIVHLRAKPPVPHM